MKKRWKKMKNFGWSLRDEGKNKINWELTHARIEPTSIYSFAVECDQLNHIKSYVDSYVHKIILSMYILKKSRRKQLRIFPLAFTRAGFNPCTSLANFPRGLFRFIIIAQYYAVGTAYTKIFRRIFTE